MLKETLLHFILSLSIYIISVILSTIFSVDHNMIEILLEFFVLLLKKKNKKGEE